MAWQDTYADEIGTWSLAYVPDAVITAMSTSHQLGIFLRMDTDPSLHVWLGVNDIPAGIDGIDSEGTVYLGGGRLLDVPTLEVLVNGQAGSAEFGISGIDPATAAEVLDEMPEVRGKAITVGLTTLDDHYQPTSSIIPIWSAKASHVSESSPPVGPEDNPTVNLSLAVVTGNSTRSRNAATLWSSAHQKALYPTDKFCDQTPRLARGVAPVWP